MAYKGKYIPKNPTKYKGNLNNIIYRSLWELKVMKYLDDHHQIIWWASEELSIPYISPVDGKTHNYYPDFIFKCITKSNQEVIHIIEIKPYKQTIKPSQKRKTKKYLEEMVVYSINQEKWRAAELFCLQHGIRFSVITENDLGF